MVSIEINKLSDLIKILEDFDNQENILFRGQAKASWPLLPKIARIMSGKCHLKIEKEILKTFIKNSYPLMNKRPNTDLSWLAVAQHHGLPTRLLDWSLNPLAALWFAVKGAPPHNDNGILWAYKPPNDTLINLLAASEEPDPFEIDRAYVYFPKHEDLRIRAQAGVFTILFRHKKTEQFAPFEETNIHSNAFTKFIIPPESFDGIKKSLMLCGIHACSLMPDLDGLAAYIISKYE